MLSFHVKQTKQSGIIYLRCPQTQLKTTCCSFIKSSFFSFVSVRQREKKREGARVCQKFVFVFLYMCNLNSLKKNLIKLIEYVYFLKLFSYKINSNSRKKKTNKTNIAKTTHPLFYIKKIDTIRFIYYFLHRIFFIIVILITF